MPTRLSVPNQRKTVTKGIVLCCRFASLSFVAIVWFGLLQRIQAAENIHPGRQVSAAPTKIQPKLVASYGKLPLSFEANQGQTDARVRFLARGDGYTIFLTDDEAILTLRKSQPGMSRFGKFGLPGRLEPFGPLDPRARRWPSLADDWKSLWRSLIPDLSQLVPEPNAGKGGVAVGLESQPPQVVRMRLVGGNAKGRVVGLDELPGRGNYFIGNDPKKWRTNVPSYARVKYEGVYPGVDLVYYGNQRQLEYDFVVAPGADPNQIKLSFAGADGMRVDGASGDLVLKVGDDEVRFQKPAVYQPTVAAVYDRRPQSSTNRASVAPASGLDARHSSLVTRHSSFVLASNNEVAFRVAGYDPKRALVIDPVLTYSTYLGGTAYDEGDGIAVDTAGNAYVTGFTGSTDFPTANPLQPSYGGDAWDAFVAKLNPAGSALVYSTYLGGSNRDGGRGIALDASGNAYVTGGTASTDFPTLNPIQGTCNNCSSSYLGLNYPDAFVAKLNSAGSALVYSTYLGGSGLDYGYGIAVDSAGNAYVVGGTGSTDFPTANPLQPNYGGGEFDAFVAKISPGGAGPSVSLSRLSLTFGPQNVGTTSALQTVTVTDTGNASLTISSITASGDFSQTNNCGSSVSTGANCTINVTFNPTAPGTRTGTLTMTDNAPGSPHAVALSGTGPDFTLTTASGSSTSATVYPGQFATYSLSVGGEGGFSGTVTVTCTGAPSEATCTVSPNPVTAGSSATNVTITVTTTAPSVSVPRSRPLPPVPPLSPGLRGLLMLALVLTAIASAMGRRNQPGVTRWQSTMVLLASGLLLTLALAGCGGGGGSANVTHNPGTLAGNYTLTVTGTAGSGSSALGHSVTLTLTVS